MRRASLIGPRSWRSDHNVGPSVFVWRVRHLVILPRRGLEGDWDDRAGRTEQAVKEFVEIEVALALLSLLEDCNTSIGLDCYSASMSTVSGR